MEKIYNIPIRPEAQSFFTLEYAAKQQKEIFEQVDKAKIRGMIPFEIIVQNNKPLVLFHVPFEA